MNKYIDYHTYGIYIIAFCKKNVVIKSKKKNKPDIVFKPVIWSLGSSILEIKLVLLSYYT